MHYLSFEDYRSSKESETQWLSAFIEFELIYKWILLIFYDAQKQHHLDYIIYRIVNNFCDTFGSKRPFTCTKWGHSVKCSVFSSVKITCKTNFLLKIGISGKFSFVVYLNLGLRLILIPTLGSTENLNFRYCNETNLFRGFPIVLKWGWSVLTAFRIQSLIDSDRTWQGTVIRKFVLKHTNYLDLYILATSIQESIQLCLKPMLSEIIGLAVAGCKSLLLNSASYWIVT